MPSNRPTPRPVRLIALRKRAGMMRSVSQLTTGSGAAIPVSLVNLRMGRLLLVVAADVGELARHRCRDRHGRADQMGPPARALAALEVAIRRRRSALAGLELVAVHGEAHRAAGLAPVEAGFLEDLVEAFLLGLFL